MRLCNGDFGGRSRVRRVGSQRGGGALPAVDAGRRRRARGRVVERLAGPVVVRAGSRGARGGGVVVAAEGVLLRDRREGESCLAQFGGRAQRRPGDVGHCDEEH